jgi:tRNA/tmRNA/rRNA uracil-C5-methylase (TrmA/RlmC/RlmD family)
MSTIRLEIGAVAHGGHCVARHEGRVVFVRHALPGETVEATLTASEADAPYWRADAVEVVEASPDRVESVWPEAGPGGVGGAELSHVALPAQRAWKHTVLRESFERFAHEEFPGDVKVAPGDDDRGGLRWRTRVGAVTDGQGRPAMHVQRSDMTRLLHAMPLAVESAERALVDARFSANAQVQVVAPGGGDDVAVLVNGVPWRNGKADHRDNAPVYVTERVQVAGKTFQYRVATGGFWQVHREAPQVLVNEVLERVGDAQSVLDLYAGAGLFTLPLADAGVRVTAVEASEQAVKAARRNLHDHPDATVVHGDVRRTLNAGIGATDVVVLDPPRSGAGHATIDALVKVGAAKLVYVACDPVALARDTQLLRERGYALTSANAWDLFPMTHHVEAIATFERA